MLSKFCGSWAHGVNHQGQIQALTVQLSAKGNFDMDKTYKLNPIDVKDIEKPDKSLPNSRFSTNVSRFTLKFDTRTRNTCSAPLKSLGR